MARVQLATPLVAKRKPMKLRKPAVRLLMDSGAYSAWRLGKPVNLEDYCDFLAENEEWIERYVCLDLINPADPEAAATQGYKNLRYMQKRGLNPVHVFHAKESLDHLHRMLDTGLDYIGLAGLSLGSHTKMLRWYESIWPYLVDAKGQPTVKVHAFGDGKWESLRKFPWKSADGASWLYAAQRSGRMMMGDGLVLSHRNDGLHTKGSPDIDQLQGLDLEAFLAFLSKHGISPDAFLDRGKEGWVMRSYVSLLHFQDLRDRVRAVQPIHFRPRNFFDDVGQSRLAAEPFIFDYYMVIGGNEGAMACLTKANHDTALISYYGLSEGGTEKLKKYLFTPEAYCNETDTPFVASCWSILNKYVKEV